MNYLLESFIYVINDPFFWASMSLTSSIGLFIGAVIYDGVLPEVKKGVVVTVTYAFLLSTTNISRILPIISREEVHSTAQPFAGVATILLVTLFYVLGMILGVYITNFAHRPKKVSAKK